MTPLPVRKMDFGFAPMQDFGDPVVVQGDPEESAMFLGMSLLFPYLEPYLIKSMRQALKEIDDPALAERVRAFCAQEGQHYRQHATFNATVPCEHRAALQALEDEVAEDYKRFSAERSLAWNLAYAEGFEAMTTAFGLAFIYERRYLDLRSPMRELAKWHTLEELEHRDVAFDVFERVCGSYWTRLKVGLFAQWHLIRFTLRARAVFLRDSRFAISRFGGLRGRARRDMAALTRLRSFLPGLLRTYLPGYRPHTIPMPPELEAWGGEMTERAVQVT